ncbi:MAG TPA: DUF4159 domain-containing protein [Bryobacteraceae bacterium]|jgi:hypothetical protein|nr:DUF4159 domain-containing protein [Bryobacteraceae bacterium]
MTLRITLACAVAGAGLLTTLFAFQRPFRVYPSMEAYDDIPLPPDYQDKSEWVEARLMYPQHPDARFGGRRWRFGESDWREGGTSWTQDYPRADRHFAMAVRRLTLVNARSVEQPVNLDDGDDVYNWPWLVAGEMGDWLLTDQQCAKLRDYLLRGGFLYLDDFWGPEEWARFDESMRRVFPDREIVEIDNKDPIFHTVYDLDDRYQILGQWALGWRGGMRDRVTGTVAQWKGIYDDHGRLMVAMSFNSDVGDSWEWADDPRYPEKYSALGMRIGVNYVVYAMTH